MPCFSCSHLPGTRKKGRASCLGWSTQAVGTTGVLRDDLPGGQIWAHVPPPSFLRDDCTGTSQHRRIPGSPSPVTYIPLGKRPGLFLCTADGRIGRAFCNAWRVRGMLRGRERRGCMWSTAGNGLLGYVWSRGDNFNTLISCRDPNGDAACRMFSNATVDDGVRAWRIMWAPQRASTRRAGPAGLWPRRLGTRLLLPLSICSIEGRGVAPCIL